MSLSFTLTGRLGAHIVLESQPVGDDPHVPLSHGAHLLYVVGNFDPVGRDQHSHGLSPTLALLNRPCFAYTYYEPTVDSQEDHAAAQPSGLELWQPTSTFKWSREGPVQSFYQTSCQLRDTEKVISYLNNDPVFILL